MHQIPNKPRTVMIIQVRTSRDLLDTLDLDFHQRGKLAKHRLRVAVRNWDGTMRIEGDYAPDASIEDHPDHPPGRTVIAVSNPRIALCHVQFESARNPVAYFELVYEENTRAEPSYQQGPWPDPSRDEANELYEN